MDQAQIRESPPATDRHPNHWATPPTKEECLKISPETLWDCDESVIFRKAIPNWWTQNSWKPEIRGWSLTEGTSSGLGYGNGNGNQVAQVNGHFVNQEQWERWQTKRKLVTGSKHRERFCMGTWALPPEKNWDCICKILHYSAFLPDNGSQCCS